MQLRRGIEPRAEDGTTMVELLVGMAMGMIVLAGISMLLIVTLHGNARVDARVEATDNARLAMTRIIEELHSACAMPRLSPVQEGSTEDELIFKHAPYGQEATIQQPVESKLVYSSADGGTLSQADETGPARTLISDVGPVPGEPIFTYYKYVNGSLDRQPASSSNEGLSEEEAAATILVSVAIQADPRSEPVADPGAAAAIRNSATFRLTPPTYYGEGALPCQ